ncbi:hypothetical protein SAMN05660706_15211, partial [Desulfoscipio geothermicus DSM 3669]
LGCLTSLTVAQVLGSAEVAASPTHPAALAFSVALSTCTLRIGTSRLPLSPPSRPSRERARCTLCRACHLRSAGLPCLSAGCPTSSAGCRPHNLLRDKPGGFSAKVSHVIRMSPAKAQVLHFPRELHPGIYREARSIGSYYSS